MTEEEEHGMTIKRNAKWQSKKCPQDERKREGRATKGCAQNTRIYAVN
jgi:hypothetical protein